MTAPDPHPVVSVLLKQLPGWLRLPSWALVVLGVGVIYWLGHEAAARSEAEGAALDQARHVLALGKAYRQQVAQLQKLEAAHLAAAATAEHRAVVYLATADSLGKVADSLQTVAQTSPAAPGSPNPLAHVVQTQSKEILALRGSVQNLQSVNDHLSGALRAADARADSAVHRVGQLEDALRGVVRASTCHILGFLPCIRNVHIGPYAGYQIVPKPQGSFGLAVMWTP